MLEKRIQIKLNGIEQLRNFVSVVSTFESDVNILKGRNIFDAKSIMGVIDIAPDSTETYVEIVSDNVPEIERFNHEMGAFRV